MDLFLVDETLMKLPDGFKAGFMNVTMRKANKVLLVEDEGSIAKPLIKLMKLRGYDLIWVNDGVEALQWLETNGPVDCMFIDIMLPKMSGWEFRERQKSDPRFKSIPAIFLSADSNSAKEAALRGEIFIPKPIDLNHLEKKLNEIVNH